MPGGEDGLVEGILAGVVVKVLVGEDREWEVWWSREKLGKAEEGDTKEAKSGE